MIKLLDSLLVESLLKEISEKTPLYHRSLKKLEVGEKIKPNNSSEGFLYKLSELALEEERKITAPDAPSRLNCIYSSLIPRSRFVDKGYLYIIKPIGKIFVADSTLIDKVMEKFDREYYEEFSRFDGRQARENYESEVRKNPAMLLRFLPTEAYYYWKGYIPKFSEQGKQALRDIEILSEGAEVREVVKESEKSVPFVVGDLVEVTDSKKLRANLTIYFNSEYEKRGEDEAKLSTDEIVDMLHKIKTQVFDGEDPEPSKYTAHTYEFRGYLKKGAKLRVTLLASSIRGGGDTYSRLNHGRKYESLMFDFFLNGKEIHRNPKKNDKNITHRLQMYIHTNEDVPDVSKYLKKV
jgi:hypothetical protein